MIKTSLLVLREIQEETTFVTPFCYHCPLSLSLDVHLFSVPEKGFTIHLDTQGGTSCIPETPIPSTTAVFHCFSYLHMLQTDLPTCLSTGTTHVQVTLSHLDGKIVAHQLFEPYTINLCSWQ